MLLTDKRNASAMLLLHSHTVWHVDTLCAQQCTAYTGSKLRQISVNILIQLMLCTLILDLMSTKRTNDASNTEQN
jgi:hypothetical protein